MKKISLFTIYILILYPVWSFAQDPVSKIKSYEEVVPADAISKNGFITTHFVNDKVLLEIPGEILGEDLLFVKHQLSGWPSENLVRFIKRDDNIQLVVPEIDSEAGNTIPLIDRKFDIVIIPDYFPILTVKKSRSGYVIDATGLFLNTPMGLNGSDASIMDELTCILEVKTFPNTIEVKTSRTVTTEDGPVSSNMDFSLMMLPEPMMPRLFDHRMGYWVENLERDIFNEPIRASIQRWRMVKKDKSSPVSEPITPLIFYLDPATPEKWKPYIKAGVYEWLPAFETAGFRNAILVKEPPVDDPDWSVNSMRYSVIRWHNRSKYRGHEGSGGSTVKKIVDPRSGEILKGDIIIGSINSLVDDYFIRCSPLDKRAQQYPFPDDLMGELIRSLTAHETGHIFGLQDGNYGEFVYPFDKMRNAEWLRKMGHTPSVMNYARHNFIVQPGDNIEPSLLIPKVGPTDHHNIRWAYTPFYGAKTPDEELPFLERIIREQDSVAYFRRNSEAHSIGPGATNEVVESDNPVASAVLGLKNLKRVMDLIPEVTRHERGNKLKKRFYLKTLELWVEQMNYVTSLVGGYTVQYKSGGQEGIVYTPVPSDLQEEAVAFLNEEAFTIPHWMIRPDITGRFIANYSYSMTDRSDMVNSTINIVSRVQIKILSLLLSSKKIRGLEENFISRGQSYTVTGLLRDLRNGLWKELEADTVKIDPYRQEIQIAYIALLKRMLKRENQKFGGEYIHMAYNKYFYSSYTRGTIYEELNIISDLLSEATGKTNNPSTAGHLRLCLRELSEFTY